MRKNLLLTVVFTLLLTLFAAAATVGDSRAESRSPQATKVAVNKVNINTATLEALDTLPGIGPKTAQKIIAWREEHGKFQRIEDLMAVKGIGEKRFARVKDLIVTD